MQTNHQHLLYRVFKVARLDPLQFLMATLAFLHLELSALRNLDRLGGSITTTLGDVLDLLDDVVALKDLAKHNVTAIEPPRITSKYCCLLKNRTRGYARSDGSRDKKLGAVGILAGIGHA